MPGPNQQRKHFLRVKEIADILDCQVGYIYGAINQGSLRAYRDHELNREMPEGNRLPWRVLKKDFKEWIGRCDSLSDPEARAQNGVERLVQAVRRQRPSQFEDWINAVNDLPSSRQRYILKRRFGLDGNAPATLAEISDELEVTRHRVYQIQLDGLKVLADNEQLQSKYQPPLPTGRDGRM